MIKRRRFKQTASLSERLVRNVEQLEAQLATLPPGPEDISYWPSRDQLWSLSEYPGRRYVYSMDRRRLGSARSLLWRW